MKKQIAIIIGAGPAGLTAAYELLRRTDIIPIIYEASGHIGGISKTINHKGNRIDTGGHRYFSKSSKVNQWWEDFLPLEESQSTANERQPANSRAPQPLTTDTVMLLRRRKSRILFLKKLFDYPFSLNYKTMGKLGLAHSLNILSSYAVNKFYPKTKEKNLEQFFINRFGKELYSYFFKDYTQKVWGCPPKKISAEWGHQRIKRLSVTKLMFDAVKNILPKAGLPSNNETETSLIKYFKYPKFGAGQMWEEVAKKVCGKGGELHLNHKVTGIKYVDNKIVSVEIRNENTKEMHSAQGTLFFSTMPIKELIESLGETAPRPIHRLAKRLAYRSFITVGVLVKKLKVANEAAGKTTNSIITDNWIYVQEKDIKMARIQIYNNWSPYLVKDKNTVWLGLEYFCNENDSFWMKKESEIIEEAVDELAKINFIDKSDMLDAIVIKTPNAYPVYRGAYKKLPEIRKFVDSFENLFLIGRNGMHKYNNMDHSMLTAMAAVDNIINESPDKNNIWNINSDEASHEE